MEQLKWLKNKRIKLSLKPVSFALAFSVLLANLPLLGFSNLVKAEESKKDKYAKTKITVSGDNKVYLAFEGFRSNIVDLNRHNPSISVLISHNGMEEEFRYSGRVQTNINIPVDKPELFDGMHKFKIKITDGTLGADSPLYLSTTDDLLPKNDAFSKDLRIVKSFEEDKKLADPPASSPEASPAPPAASPGPEISDEAEPMSPSMPQEEPNKKRIKAELDKTKEEAINKVVGNKELSPGIVARLIQTIETSYNKALEKLNSFNETDLDQIKNQEKAKENEEAVKANLKDLVETVGQEIEEGLRFREEQLRKEEENRLKLAKKARVDMTRSEIKERITQQKEAAIQKMNEAKDLTDGIRARLIETILKTYDMAETKLNSLSDDDLDFEANPDKANQNRQAVQNITSGLLDLVEKEIKEGLKYEFDKKREKALKEHHEKEEKKEEGPKSEVPAVPAPIAPPAPPSEPSPMQPAPAPEEEEGDSSSDLADKVIAFQDKHAEILALEKADLSLEHEAKLLLAKKDFMALEAEVQAQLSVEKDILDDLEAKLEELKKAKKESEVPAQPELAQPEAKLESSLLDEAGSSKTSFVVGEEARLVIRGLKANEKFKLELHSKVYELGSFEADAKGEASIKFEIPTDIEEGKHQLVVKRTGLEDTKLELNVVVKEMLPETGEANSLIYGLGAIMMLSLGLVVLGLKKSLVAKD